MVLSRIDSIKSQATIQAEAAFNQDALLHRIKAMFALFAKDGFMLTIYILLHYFFFFWSSWLLYLKYVVNSQWMKNGSSERLSLNRKNEKDY